MKKTLLVSALALAIVGVFAFKNMNKPTASDVYFKNASNVCTLWLSNDSHFSTTGTTAAEIQSSTAGEIPLYATSSCLSTARVYFSN